MTADHNLGGWFREDGDPAWVLRPYFLLEIY